MAMVSSFPEINPYAYANVYRYEEEKEEEKRIMHYTSSQQILIVGDGDFSFSLCLAKAFGSGNNIVATSLDSFDTLMNKYTQACANLKELKSLGADLFHKVDVTKMRLHTDLKKRKFDRIIFNFPHAGFHGKEDNVEVIKMHRHIVHGFFRNARGMLRPYGEIHVTHKTNAPYCYWKLEELAKDSSLLTIDCVDFKIDDYPGYNNKRGHGTRPDDPFSSKVSRTYKFIFSPSAKSFPPKRPPHGLDIQDTCIPIETRMPCYGIGFDLFNSVLQALPIGFGFR